ncbi:MAG: cytotoxin [Defluviitaleaceae bacterium]|nr:cytotoxin [Defluviitaleaceae bacterium]
MYKLVSSKSFEKSIKKFSKKEQRAIYSKLQILENNPFYPSLRTKKVLRLKNIFEDDVFESSVNMDIRIFWRYQDGKIILLVNVSHHDML